MLIKFLKLFLSISISLCSTAAFSQDDTDTLTRGEKIYKRCAICHMITEQKNRVGPSLHNIYNRKAGSLENFRYSPAIKSAGEAGLVWNEKTLVEFLSNPQAMIKGNRMANIRFSKDENLDDLITYILKVSSQDIEK